MTAEAAWQEGTTIDTALRYEPERTRAEIVRMIKDVVDYRDETKTLRTVNDVVFAAETLLDMFPAVRLEEFRLVCDRMKQGYYGKYFGRLKVEEFRDALILLEEERAGMIEMMHKRNAEGITRGAADLTNITYKPTSMQELMRQKNPYIGGKISREAAREQDELLEAYKEENDE